MIQFKDDKQLAATDLQALYNSVGWSAYTNDLPRLEKAVAQSLAVRSAWDRERLVGLIRVVGDGETIIYIQDILVDPAYQNQQLGSHLLTFVLETFQHVRQKTLLTEEAPDVRHFYQKFGFTSCDQGGAVAFYKEF